MAKIQFESLKSCLDKSFAEYLKMKVFPGASIGISFFMDGEFHRTISCYGKIDDSEIDINKNTLFDLASLTKPLVTVFSLLALIEEKKIYWKENLKSLISCDIPKDKKKITLDSLMSHRSGLPAHRPYFKELIKIDSDRRKTEMIKLILKEKLIYETGRNTLYSDLGYILLGYIIEEKSGKKLDDFWRQKIIAPLHLEKELLFLKIKERDKKIFASTGYSSMMKKKLYGIVHDDNCRILGGVAGHAGLFGTVQGILSLCERILMIYYDQFSHPSFGNDTLRMVLELRDNSPRTLGFDIPSPTASSSGKYFSKKTVGHLGFTGTSFWIDLQRKICVVFLSNRIFFGEENEKLKKVRPALHDIIMKEINIM